MPLVYGNVYTWRVSRGPHVPGKKHHAGESKMKSLLTVAASLLAFAAGATEIELVTGSVAEDASIGLAGVAYKVSYDDATHKVIFKAKGETTASNCALIFHAVSIQDDAGKSVNGYNGNCGHTPGPTDVLMTDDGTGWLAFSIDANDYTPSLGMFLTVVLRQDNARNLERFFGLCSMTAPNDWASFDGSWDNRIKIAVPTPRVQINMIYPSPYLPGSADPAAPSSMGENFRFTYTILPSGFVADTAGFTVKDNRGTVVFTGSAPGLLGGPSYMARWLVSTDSLRSINSNMGPYEVTIKMTKGTYSYQDSKSLEVVLSTATVEAERSPTTGTPITECMQSRAVTFTATAKGFVSDSRHQIKYDYNFRHANGTWYNVIKWARTLTNQHTIVTENCAPGFSSYLMNPFVEVSDAYTHSATSQDIPLAVYKLWITYFRNAGGGSDWNVCVGSNIEYKANASLDCTRWLWEMPDGWFGRVWQPTGGNARQGTAMIIPYTDLTSARNRYFGKAYGTVRVSCKDEEARSYSFASTTISSTTKAAVFFDPDKNRAGGTPSTANPPCWFEFWKDGDVVDGLSSISYDQAIDYGATDGTTGNIKVGYKAAEENNDGWGHTLTNLLGVAFSHTGSGKHLQCLAETIAHEEYHQYVTRNWARGVASHSDRDELPDAKETAPDRAYFQVSLPNNYDSFRFGYSTWYDDQEVRCRIIEMSAPKRAYPDKDWSCDGENPKW